MKKFLLRLIVVLAVLVVVVVVAAFLSLNSIVKKAVDTYGPQMTKVDVRLGSADLSPFSGSGKLSQLFVGNPDGYKTPFAIQLGSVDVGVEIGSVFHDTVIVDEINIQQPEITLEGTLDGNNLKTILDNITSSGSTQTQQPSAVAPSGEKKQKKFIVKDIVLAGAKVHVNVSGFGKSYAQTVSIPDIHLQNVGNGAGGVSNGELVKQILDPVVKEALAAAADGLKNQGVQELEKKVGPQLDKALGSNTSKALGGALTNFLK
jgi:AsmA family